MIEYPRFFVTLGIMMKTNNVWFLMYYTDKWYILLKMQLFMNKNSEVSLSTSNPEVAGSIKCEKYIDDIVKFYTYLVLLCTYYFL